MSQIMKNKLSFLDDILYSIEQKHTLISPYQKKMATKKDWYRQVEDERCRKIQLFFILSSIVFVVFY
jgi:hypothetical protein